MVNDEIGREKCRKLFKKLSYKGEREGKCQKRGLGYREFFLRIEKV